MAAMVSQCDTILNYCLRQFLSVASAERGSCGHSESLDGFLSSNAMEGVTYKLGNTNIWFAYGPICLARILEHPL